MDNEVLNDLSKKIIGLAIDVHKELGPGLLESIYEKALCIELENAKINYKCQEAINVNYKGNNLDFGYRADIVVENKIILELKSVENLLPIHQAQLMTYLKLSKLRLGLLINFNVQLLKHGIRRIVN